MTLHRKLRLVGYIRTGGTEVSADRQRQAIKDYCASHDCEVTAFTVVDTKRPSYGLEQALEALSYTDGIITYDLNRLVWHEDDRLLDLRPLVDHVHRRSKVIITIEDDFETVTPEGQERLLALLHEWSDRESVSLPTRSDFESVIPGTLYFD